VTVAWWAEVAVADTPRLVAAGGLGDDGCLLCPMCGVPSAEELAALPPAELAVRLAEAYRLIGELSAQVEHLSPLVEELPPGASHRGK